MSGDAVEIARITITRSLGDDDVVWTEFLDGNGDQLPLIETLGVLRMAEDTAIRQAMGEDDA